MKILVLTGGQYWDGSHTYASTKTFISYDAETWLSLKPPAVAVSGTRPAVKPEGAYVPAGYYPSISSKTILRTNGITTEVVTDTTAYDARCAPSIIAVADDLLIFGGFLLPTTLFTDVWKSSDNGKTWLLQSTIAGMRTDYSLSYVSNEAIRLATGRLLAWDGTTSLWSSVDDGATWLVRNDALPFTTETRGPTQHLFALDGSSVLAIDVLTDGWTHNYISHDAGLNWSDLGYAPWILPTWTDSELSGFSLVRRSTGELIIIGGAFTWNGYNNDIWSSIDNGVTWSIVGSCPFLTLKEAALFEIEATLGSDELDEGGRRGRRR